MENRHHSLSRRNFVHAGSLLLAATAIPTRLMAAEPASGNQLFTAMGLSGSIDQAATLKSDGADFLTESVGKFLMPDKPEEEFAKNLAKLANSPLPILACNGFIRPADLHCIGPDANHDLICAWAETTFRRLKMANGKFIVFGSASSRRLPDGWPKEKADAQFITLLKLLGPLAEAHGVTVTVEQLRAVECNYLNHLSHGAALIRATGHPRIRLLADLYHMATMGDTPADLKAAMDVVAHIEIAEKADRTVPGVAGDDFRPFFRVLKQSDYRGAISIEGKAGEGQVKTAFAEIRKQASES